MIHVRCSLLNLDKNTIIYQLSICAQYSTNRYSIIREDRQSPITHVIITIITLIRDDFSIVQMFVIIQGLRDVWYLRQC